MNQDEKLEARVSGAVQRLRTERGWSQAELAEKMRERGFTKFHPTTISRIEKGDRPVRIAEALGLARVLGTSVARMMVPTEDAKVLDQLFAAVDDHTAVENAIFDGFEKWILYKAMVHELASRAIEIDLRGLEESEQAAVRRVLRSASYIESVELSDLPALYDTKVANDALRADDPAT